MAPLATAFIEIRPDLSAVKHESERSFDAAGKKSGEAFGDSFSRAAQGRMRDERGRFVSENKDTGTQSGKTFGKSFSDAFRRAIPDQSQPGRDSGESFGAGFGTALTGAVVVAAAALGPAFAAALDMDAAKGKLTAELGLTASESERIGGVAGKLFTSAYGESMDQVKTAISSVIQNIDGMRTASDSSLRATTARALDLATVLGEDVTAVTRTVSQLLRTGMAKNAQDAFDIITKGAQGGANKSQDLLETLNEYPTQFRKLGLNGQQAMGILSQGLRAGARDADIVADALKEFSIRAVDGSKLTAQGFKALGLSGEDMARRIAKGGPTARAALDQVLDRLRGIKDPIKQSQVAVALFGTQAEDLGKALFSLDPSKATKALGQFRGATDRAGKALGETSQAKLTAFGRSIQHNMVDVLAKAIPAITSAMSGFQSVFGPVIGWLFGGSTAAAALRGALMGLAIAIAAVYTAQAIWTGIQWALNAALTANPIGIIIVAIAALVGAIILAYRNSETFRNVVQTAWRGIQVAIKFAWENVIQPVFKFLSGFIKTVLVPIFKFLWTVIKIVWKGIWVQIQAAWFVIKVVFALIAFQVRTIWKVFQLLWNITKPIWQGLGRLIMSVWNSVIRPAFNALKTALGAVKTSFSTAISAIKTTWEKLKDITKKPVSFVVNTVYMGGIRKVWEGVRGMVPGLPALPAVRFAQGGIFPGYTPGRDVWTMPMAAFSGGEAIMRPEFTRAVGSDFVRTGNAIAQRGGPMAVRAWMSGGQAFVDGGILGSIKGILRKPLDLARHAGSAILEQGASAFSKKILDPILKNIPGADSTWARAIFSLPSKMINGFLAFIKRVIDPVLSGGDRYGVVRAAKRYIGVGDDRGVDNNNRFTRGWGWPSGTPWCALFVSQAIKDARAQGHYRGWPTAAARGYNSMRNVGTGQGQPGDLATYNRDGHINIIEKAAGRGYWTIGGNQNSLVQRSIRSGQYRILRPNARGGIATDVWRRVFGYEWQHNWGGEHDRNNPLAQVYSRMPATAGAQLGRDIVKGYVFDSGGILHPGDVAINLSKKPETVLNNDQLSTLLGVRRAGNNPAVVFSGDIHISDGSDLDRLMKRAEFEARASGFGGV